MKDSQSRQMDSSARVHEFNAAHAATAGPRAVELAGMHDAVITETRMWAGKQAAAHLDWQEQTEQKNAAIKSLQDELRAMSLTARSINKQFPGIADQFKMPRNSDQNVINTAYAFIEAATPIASEFKKRGSADAFLTNTQTKIDAVVAAEGRQATALANRTTATTNLEAALRRERDIVRELNAIYRNTFRSDPGILAAWDNARRIEKAPEKKKEDEPPPPPKL
jgi:hypothetical protein